MTVYKNIKHGYLVEIWREDQEADPVKFCPQGGGFQMSAPRAQFFAEFEVAPPPEFKLGTVSAEFMQDENGEPIYLQAYSNGRKWNGWGMPYFPRHSVEKLMEISNEGGLYPLAWNGDNVVIKDDDAEGGFYELTPVMMPGGVPAWDVGSGCWTWDSVEFPPTLDETVARMKKEILEDTEYDLASATSFSELHDRCDANCLGGFCEDELADRLIAYFGGRDEATEGMPDAMLDYINAAQGAIDEWLKAGKV